MRASLRLYWAAFATSLQAKFEYRVDLLLGVGMSVLAQLAALGFLLIALGSSESLAGWSGAQVLFLFGLTATCLGASELLFNQIWMLPQCIVMGDLDRLLTYPVNTLLFFLVTRPELHALGNLLVGAAYLISSLLALQAPWYAWLAVPLCAACGTLLYTSALVIVASLSFRVLGPFSYHLLLPLNLMQASRYPLSVYPGWLRGLLLFGVPYGFCSYLPARSLLLGDQSPWLLAVMPLLTALFVLLAQLCWTRGLRRYESSGS